MQLRRPAPSSPFEVRDAPKGLLKVRRGAPGSLHYRSLREIADSTERSLRQPAWSLAPDYFFFVSIGLTTNWKIL